MGGAQPLQAFGLVREWRLAPRQALDHGLNLFGAAHQRLGVGQHHRRVDPADFLQQAEQGFGDGGGADPVAVLGRQARHVLHQVHPGEHPRSDLQGQGHGRGIEVGQLGQLAVDGEIARPRAMTENEGLGLQMRLEGLQEPAVAGLDHRPGHGVGSHHIEPADLAVGEHLLGGGVVRLAHRKASPQGKNGPGPVDVVGVGPAIMEHGLGQPLVGIVLDQLVQEGHGRVVRQHAAPFELPLQPPDDRRGIHHRLQLPLVVGQVEGRQQLHLRPRQIGQGLTARGQEAVGDAPVAQHPEHLAGVGRSGRAAEGDGHAHGAGLQRQRKMFRRLE